MSPTTRGKGEGSVYQRASDGMWCVSVELPPGADGKRRRRVVCRKDKRKAIEELRKAQADLEQHGDIVVRSMTLGEWLDYWIENIYAPRNEPGTTKNARGHIRKWIKPTIGDRPLSKVTPSHVRLVHKAIEEGSTSTTLVRAVHNTLSTALRDAVREGGGLLRQNPCDLMDRPGMLMGERDGLTLDQAVQLLAHIATRPDRAMWATFLLTGARRGEVLGLETDRVGETILFSWQLKRISNFEDAPKTRVYRHMGGKLYLSALKSRKGNIQKGREIPLVEPLRSILALHMQGRGPGLVFTEPDGSAIKPDDITLRWHRLLKDAGLPDDTVLHGSRHTTVDLLVMAGVPMHTIKDIVGHTTEAMTAKYTRRANLPQLESAMEKMGALLSLPSNPQPEDES
jgi:integrase